MKRNRLPALAAVFVLLVVILLSTGIAAASVPSWTLQTTKGTTITQDTYSDKVQLMVFTIMNQGSSSTYGELIEDLAQSWWSANDDLQIIAIDSYFKSNSIEDVSLFGERYGSQNIVFAAGGNNLMWEFWREYTAGNNSISWPACAIVKNGEIQEMWIRVKDATECAERMSQYADFSNEQIYFTQSGCLDIAKLSKTEIASLLSDNPLQMPTDIFDIQPSVTAPYVAGKVKTELLQHTADRLNALRLIAGLPSVVLDETYCESNQYGAVLNAASGTGHYPTQPSDMDDDFYERGYLSTTHSNLFYGRELITTPDGFMDDPGASNISRLGHRRWQLNPKMGKVGFGYIVAQGTSYTRYTNEWSFDNSGQVGYYDFISWPASGNFPNDQPAFNYNTAWSVTLNPATFQQPDISEVEVTLKRESDNATWSFSNAKSYTAAASGEYFNVETSNYGVANCIIFRPEGISAYDGVYTVTVNGIKTSLGTDATVEFQVDFFKSRDYCFSGSFNSSGVLIANAAASEDAMLVAVSYDSTGKQKELKMIPVASGDTFNKYDTGLTRKYGFEYKLMLVSKYTFEPLCGAWSSQ